MERERPHSSILEKTLSVLDLLNQSNRSLTFSEIQSGLNFTKSTGHRILTLMTEYGLVLYDKKNKTYRTGYRVMSWAAKAWQDIDLRDLAETEMQELSAQKGENVLLAVHDGTEIVYMHRVESVKKIRSIATIGARAPIHCTGLGKAIMAFLPSGEQQKIISNIKWEKLTENTITNPKQFERELVEIRQRGYSFDDREHQQEINCIAAPILNIEREVIGAISVTAPAFRVNSGTLHKWSSDLLETTRQISEKIGYIAPIERQKRHDIAS